MAEPLPILPVIDLGRMPYALAYERQLAEHARVLAHRERGSPVAGVLLLVEHDPVITVSHRPEAAAHVLASTNQLAAEGVEVRETDRGGDVTYHGPGQLVVYPIIDLNGLHLRLHEYLRALEEAIIECCGHFGVPTRREPGATGVWTVPNQSEGAPSRKIAAIGVRVRRWITLHGLALNVATNLGHFDLINPCGLGRPVTSLHRELGTRSPGMSSVKPILADSLRRALAQGQRER